MAAWFAVEIDADQHPKFLAFCESSGLKHLEALGILYRLWNVTRKHCPNGRLRGYTQTTLEIVLQSPGVVRHLITCGYVEDSDGTLVVHDWMERNGRWIKDIRRKRKSIKKIASSDIPEAIRRHSGAISSSSSSSTESKDSPPQVPLSSRRGRVAENLPPHFLDGWGGYPRPVGRRAAAQAFEKALRRHPTLEPGDLAWSMAEFGKKCSRDGTEPRFTPHPATWLNQDRFLEFFDEAQEHTNGQP